MNAEKRKRVHDELEEELGYPSGRLTCQVCGAENASQNKQRTAYIDSNNMAILCPQCQKEADEYWTEQWDDYCDNLM